jgi:hypothetical protein
MQETIFYFSLIPGQRTLKLKVVSDKFMRPWLSCMVQNWITHVANIQCDA